MKFEHLALNHSTALLQFEQENQAFFESLIAPRIKEFYSPSGIQKHIENCLLCYKNKTAYAGVALNEGLIIGRGNLKDINQIDKSAYVGYRIGEHHTGKGVASFCLTKLIDLAKDEMNLNSLFAEVLDNNPASMRVLIKQGFKVIDYQKAHSVVNGVNYGCTLLKKSLSN